MELLEKGFDLCTPYGNSNKKLKDFDKNDFCWLSERDRINLLAEMKEEYHAMVLDYKTMTDEYYRILTLKCKDCDSEARLNYAKAQFEKIALNFCVSNNN